MRRIAPKGLVVAQAGQARCAPIDRGRDVVPREQVWQPISWDEALDEIASRFRAISAEFGSEAILPYSYGGTLGALNGASMDRRFFHRPGASRVERTICSAAVHVALKA